MEGLAELLGHVLVEEAHDEADLRVDVADVEGDLEVDEVVVGAGDDAGGVFDAEVAQEALAAGVADDEGDAAGAGLLDELAVVAGLDGDDLAAAAEQLAEDAEADVAEADQDDVVAVDLGHDAHPCLAMVGEVHQRGADLEQALGDDEGAGDRHGEVQDPQDPVVREVGEVLEEELGVDEEAGLDEVEVLDDLGVAAPQQDSAADDQQADEDQEAADQEATGVGGEAQAGPQRRVHPAQLDGHRGARYRGARALAKSGRAMRIKPVTPGAGPLHRGAGPRVRCGRGPAFV